MANEFIARNGLISQNNSEVTGSLTVTGGITGSLLGTATTASYLSTPSLTSGSVLFSDGTTIAQKNSNFFWDNTNNRLGIGTNAPAATLDILDTKTATVNNQVGAFNILGTFTARATASDSLTSIQNSQTLVASANNQKLVGTTLKNAYTLGAFTGITTFPLEIYGVNNYGVIRVKTSANGNENKVILGDWTNAGFATKLTFLRPSGASEATTMIQGNSVFTIDNVNGAICFNAYANTSNVLINTITDNGGKLQIKAGGALSTDIALRVRNSADTGDLMTVNGLGTVSVITASQRISFNLNNGIYLGLGVNNNAIGVNNSNRLFIGSEGDFPIYSLANGTVIITNTANPTASPSAKFRIDSTTQGFLPPRMTNAERIAIATPAVGLMVYCTDATEGLYINKSTGWTFII